MHRLFFALWPDDALRREIESAALQLRMRAGGRAVRSDRYHMTLQFLGDFDVLSPGLLASLRVAADTIVMPAPFELSLDRIGSFGAGRVLWLGCSEAQPQLTQLQSDLGDALAAVGIAIESQTRFVPHVTVQRNARAALEGPTPSVRWQVQGLVLIDSTADDYRMLGHWPLGT